MYSPPSQFDSIAYVFQGGGALGAYQVGVIQALLENGYEPTWMIGTSIGALNAAIVVGNQPEDRIPKLKKFWNDISHSILPGFTPQDDAARRWYNYTSAQYSLWFGQEGFFNPRLDAPCNFIKGTADNISFYSLEPLRQSLEELVNFDLINSKKIRFTVGAVEVCKGKSVYFDNTKRKILPQHILASCALPPGFPAVEVEGNFYWDGGVLSNSPTEVLVSEAEHSNTLCFMANLFDSYGLHPTSMDDVLKRYKDIVYSSRYRTQVLSYRELLRLYGAVRLLYDKLPNELKEDPAIKELHDSIGDKTSAMHFVRFLYTAPPTELSSKDYEFSKLSIDERMQAGYQDGLNAVRHSPWLQPIPMPEKVAIHEICSHTTLLEMMDRERQLNQQKDTIEFA